MNDITLKINNSNAEIGEVNISLSYNITSPTQPDLRGLPASYTIKIPKTNTNLRLVNESNVNTAIVEVDYLPIISGELIINSSDIDYWNCTITSSDVNFIKEFGSKSLKDLKEFLYIDQTFKQASLYNRRDVDYIPFALDYELDLYLDNMTIDKNQIVNQKYKSHLKPKSLNFALQSFGNFYRLPNKDVSRVDNNGRFTIKEGANYLSGTPTVFPEVPPYPLNTPITDIKGYIPPVKTLLLATKLKDSYNILDSNTDVIYLQGYIADIKRLESSKELIIGAIAGDAKSWQLLEENEIYTFLLFDSLAPANPTFEMRYLGADNSSNNTETLAKFAITTDELKNFDLIDSLAYNDIPPVFNFYNILEKLFSQYGIVLKTDDIIYNKLINESLTYNGDGFKYNYKNHLGTCKLTDELQVDNQNTFYFNGLRTYLSSLYMQNIVYEPTYFLDRGSIVPIASGGNTLEVAYYDVNILGIWDSYRTTEAATGRNRYDYFSQDGVFTTKDRINSFNDKTTLFYTLPFYYETYHKQAFEKQILFDTQNSLNSINDQYEVTKIVNPDLGLLENTTLSGNKFTVNTTSLKNAEASKNYPTYTGKTNYGFGYRCADSGMITMSIDLDYTTNDFVRSEWGYFNGGSIPSNILPKPVYLIVTKIKDFKDYETIDAGLTKYGNPLPNTDTIVKYWDLVDYNPTSLNYELMKKVKETFTFKVSEGEIINMYIVFNGFTYNYPNFVIPDSGFSSATFDYVFDYTAQMELTKCDVNIMLNSDYFIDIAKNLPDINQLQFFKDVLVENRLLPYYDNISKTMTLKQFNDVAKDHIVLDKFNIEEADEFNVFNKNLVIGYTKETNNKFNKPELYDFKYNTVTNKDTFTYNFSYSKSEESIFKTYATSLDKTAGELLETNREYVITTSYEVNPLVNNTTPLSLNQKNFLSGGLTGLEKYEVLNTASSTPFNLDNRFSNKGMLLDRYKQLFISTIMSNDVSKVIGRDVNWNFDYNTTKVTIKPYIGIRHYSDGTLLNQIQSIDIESQIIGSDNFTYLKRVTTTNESFKLGKREFDSFFLEGFKTFKSYASNGVTTIIGDNNWRGTYELQPRFNGDDYVFDVFTQKITPIAQRGQYRFRNGLLTNESDSNFGFNDNDLFKIQTDEIQTFATKDFDFVNHFYRNYGYNFEKEIENNTLTISGILPFNDYYDIVNKGIVKVWFDNSWYYLLEVVKFDVETEQCTLKVVRKIYGD